MAKQPQVRGFITAVDRSNFGGETTIRFVSTLKDQNLEARLIDAIRTHAEVGLILPGSPLPSNPTLHRSETVPVNVERFEASRTEAGVMGMVKFSVYVDDSRLATHFARAIEQKLQFRVIVPETTRQLSEDEAFEVWFKREGYKEENRGVARQTWEGAVKWGRTGGNPASFCGFRPLREVYNLQEPGRCMLYAGHDNGVHDQ